MTRKIHDSFAKECMAALLADFGQVEIEKQLSDEVRTIDIVFHPDPNAADRRLALGILGQMVAHLVLIEPFRNPVPEWEIRNCREKLFRFESELRRIAKRQKHRIAPNELPFVWILSPTLSPHLQREFCVKQQAQWGQGIYFLPNPDRTAIIAIHELPQTLDTLWLRLLGRGRVQATAIRELIERPSNHPYRQEAMRHLAILQVHLKTRQNKTKDIREVVMSLSPLYEKWEQETLDRGRQEGRQEGRREGRQEGRQAIALSMLQSQRYSLEEIAELTQLPIDQLQVIQATL
ncbi:MAG: hypothetical protein RLZZ511_2102 [Cyanobacteriota bacterium]|jgi:hypothetical protein